MGNRKLADFLKLVPEDVKDRVAKMNDEILMKHAMKCCDELKLGNIVSLNGHLAVICGMDWNGITYDLLDGSEVAEWCEWKFVSFVPSYPEVIRGLFGFEDMKDEEEDGFVIWPFSLHNVIDGTSDFVVKFCLNQETNLYISQDILPNYTEVAFIHNLQNAYEVICGHKLKAKNINYEPN